jgi:hypothetical protein
MAPPPFSAIAGAYAAVSKNGALTSMANMASKPESVVSSVGANSQKPALLTRMSVGPASRISRCTSSGSLRSAAMKRAGALELASSSTTACPRALSRPVTVTAAPC